MRAEERGYASFAVGIASPNARTSPTSIWWRSSAPCDVEHGRWAPRPELNPNDLGAVDWFRLDSAGLEGNPRFQA